MNDNNTAGDNASAALPEEPTGKTARRKSGLGFAAMQEFIGKQEPKAGRSSIGSPVESPAFQRKARETDAVAGNTFTLTLPVSKQDLLMTYTELDPRDCFPSPLNPREQSLLSLEDPDIARIKHSIERESQREPVKARLKHSDDGRTQWEIIEGTTRLFIAKTLTEERGVVVPLKAWVGEVPDIDIRRLAKAENRDRRDLSVWETARALAVDVTTIYQGRQQEYIAEREGCSQATISNLLKLAELDLRIVRLVLTPSQISLKAGLQLVSQWAALKPADQASVLEELAAKAPYLDAAALVRELKAVVLRRSTAAAKPIKKPLIVQTKAGVVARLSPHRTQSGQYKVDLFNFSDAEAAAILRFVKELKKD